VKISRRSPAVFRVIRKPSAAFVPERRHREISIYGVAANRITDDKGDGMPIW